MISQNEQPNIITSWQFDFIFLLSACLAALFLRQMMYVRLFPDSIDYLSFAKNILSGIHHTGNITLARYRRPPLYPHMVALFSFGGSSPAYLAEIARQVSIFAGSLLVIPVYLLGRKMVGRTAAISAALLVVITPEFLYYSGAVLTESLGTLFITIGMFILWVSCSKKANNSTWLLVGFSLGLGFLSRHLLIGYVAIGLIWLVFSKLVRCETIRFNSDSARFKRVAPPFLLVLAAFFLTVSPQILYLHSETGRWSLAIDPFSSSSMKVKYVGKDMRNTEVYEARASLTSDKERYLWETGESPGLLSLMKKHPDQYIKAYVLTLLRGYLPDTYPLPYPIIIIILAIVGIIGMVKEKKFMEFLFFLWAFVGYYLFLTLFLTMRDRYMFPAYPFLLLAAGAGTATAVKFVSNLIGNLFQTKNAKGIANTFLFALIVASIFPASVALIREQSALANTAFFQHLGRHLSKRIEKNAVIIDRTPHLSFFSGGVKTTPPYAEIEDVLHFAKERGVNYWVVSSSYVPSLRPQYSPLLNPNQDHEGLEPVAVYKGRGDFIIIVYRIQSD